LGQSFAESIKRIRSSKNKAHRRTEGCPKEAGPLQQHSAPPEQSQLGSLPVSHPMITAAAHPTPVSTEIALAGQLSAQAPHSIH